MSADHRKPVVAFVVLAFLAAALVGVQRADAQAGRFMAAVLGGDVHAQGQVRPVETSGRPGPSALPEALTLTSAGPTASAVPPAARPHARKSQVSRSLGRSDAPAAADRHPSRSGASGEPSDDASPAEHAADQGRAAASRSMPERAVAKGHSPDERGHRPAHSRSTR